MRRVLPIVLLGWVAGCAGEVPTPPATSIPESIATLDAIQEVTVPPGGSADVQVSLRIEDSFHVQANPAANEFLIPLDLRLEAVAGVEFGPPEYPPPNLYRLQGTDEDLLTYEGAVVITAPVTVAADTAPGPREVTGSLRYQACNDVRCFSPTTVPVTFTVVVGP